MKRLLKSGCLCLLVIIMAISGAFIGSFAVEPNRDTSSAALERLAQYPESFQEIRQRDDLVIEIQGVIYNRNLWDSFYSRVQNGESADIVIARATTEGDPVLDYIRFDATTERTAFYLTEDWSRDSYFGVEEPHYISECYEHLQELPMGDYKTYILTHRLFDSADDYQAYIEAERDQAPVIVFREPISGNDSNSNTKTHEIAPQFSDIQGHWSEAAVNRLTKAGIINGYPDGTFRPEAYVTRAEVAKIISIAFGLDSPTEIDYPDVQDDWFYYYVALADRYMPEYGPYESGRPYTDPYIRNYNSYTSSGEKFLPQQADLRMFLAETLSVLKAQREGVEITFPEVSKIEDELSENFIDGHFSERLTDPHGNKPLNYVRMLQYCWLSWKMGIFEGDDNHWFGPMEPVTRAALVVTVDRVLSDDFFRMPPFVYFDLNQMKALSVSCYSSGKGTVYESGEILERLTKCLNSIQISTSGERVPKSDADKTKIYYFHTTKKDDPEQNIIGLEISDEYVWRPLSNHDDELFYLRFKVKNPEVTREIVEIMDSEFVDSE